MRGKVFSAAWDTIKGGITPAYAGKSSLNADEAYPDRDHPRLCGEKCLRGAVNGTKLGSPPPMRGKGAEGGTNLRNIRITPAYAGKSSDSSNCRLCHRDHPRLCGEKTKKILKQRYFFHQPASFSFSLQYT